MRERERRGDTEKRFEKDSCSPIQVAQHSTWREIPGKTKRTRQQQQKQMFIEQQQPLRVCLTGKLVADKHTTNQPTNQPAQTHDTDAQVDNREWLPLLLPLKQKVMRSSTTQQLLLLEVCYVNRQTRQEDCATANWSRGHSMDDNCALYSGSSSSSSSYSKVEGIQADNRPPPPQYDHQQQQD